MNWQGLQVLMTFDLAERLGVSRHHLLRNFARHRHMMTEGVHYFVLSGTALYEWKDIYAKGLHTGVCIVWTEKGAYYLMQTFRAPRVRANYIERVFPYFWEGSK